MAEVAEQKEDVLAGIDPAAFDPEAQQQAAKQREIDGLKEKRKELDDAINDICVSLFTAISQTSELMARIAPDVDHSPSKTTQLAKGVLAIDKAIDVIKGYDE